MRSNLRLNSEFPKQREQRQIANSVGLGKEYPNVWEFFYAFVTEKCEVSEDKFTLIDVFHTKNIDSSLLTS